MIEQKKRLDSVKRLLRRKHCSHVLIIDTVQVQYISGFHSSNATLLIGKDTNLLFSDFRYNEAAIAFCRKNPAWTFVLITEGNFEYLGPYLPKGSVIGYESNVVTVDQLAELGKAARGNKFVALSSDLAEVTIPKTPLEIGYMRTAARIGDRAFTGILDHIRPGITELELARTLERLCSELGSEKPSFDTIVLFGNRSALPHGQPGRRKLQPGDWVLIDFGCTVKGFCSDMTRTVVAGTASERHRQIYTTVKHAQALARKAARAGMSSSALDAVARREIDAGGFRDAFGHALGHGVGLRIHEKPRVSPHVNVKLRTGSVITIEPGIYLAGFGGVRIEDMVVLTETGSKLLTHSTRELIEVKA